MKRKFKTIFIIFICILSVLNAFGIKELDNIYIKYGYSYPMGGYDVTNNYHTIDGWYSYVPYSAFYLYSVDKKWGIYLYDRGNWCKNNNRNLSNSDRDRHIFSTALAIDSIQKKVNENFGRNSFDGKGSITVINMFQPDFPEVHFPNARYYDVTQEIELNDWTGSSEYMNNYYYGFKMLAHEYMHGVTKSKRDGYAITPALSEGYSDIFAVIMEKWVRGRTDWKVFERDLKKLTTYPSQDEFHEQGLILGHAFYLLTEGGVDFYGNYFSGIGFDNAAKIAFFANTEASIKEVNWDNIVTTWIETANYRGMSRYVPAIKKVFKKVGLKRADLPVKAINCGGEAYTSYSEINYEKDNYYSGGKNENQHGLQINNTLNDKVYQSERYGIFSYNIPLNENGSYKVVLQFSENYWSNEGDRIFDIIIEGKNGYDNYDIMKKVENNTAVDISFSVNIYDKELNISLERQGADVAKLCGILIYRTQKYDPGKIVKAINCGASSYTIVNGINYEPDIGYGKQYVVKYPLSSVLKKGHTNDVTQGTLDNQLYQTERYGDNFILTADGLIPEKNYIVRFHFSELYWNEEGGRVFVIKDSSGKELPLNRKLDLYKLCGHDHAYELEISFKAKSNDINISLVSTKNYGADLSDFAKISAVTVYEVD